jgi:hypothetical protein
VYEYVYVYVVIAPKQFKTFKHILLLVQYHLLVILL